MDIKIIIEGGEKLSDADLEEYYKMTTKIQTLVKETFPLVRYCSVESWGPGYYRGAQVRKVLLEVLNEKKLINKLASAIRDLPVET